MHKDSSIGIAEEIIQLFLSK